jgi:hypothetical protein
MKAIAFQLDGSVMLNVTFIDQLPTQLNLALTEQCCL